MAISLNNIVKKYKPSFELVVKNLEINDGEIVGIIGNNGVGKTTLLKAILDLIKLEQGNIYINNIFVNEDESWKKITGAFLNHSFLIDFLTPIEYFELIGSLYELKRDKLQKRLEIFLDFLSSELIKENGKLIRELSDGNKQKVGIVGALITEPQFLVLDEPHSNLDPKSQIILKNLLNELNKSQKTTMLISSHNLNFVSEICDRIILLENGKIIADEKVKEDTLEKLNEYFSPNNSTGTFVLKK